MRRLVLALLLCGSSAHADWEVRRAPDDPRVEQALLSALLNAPNDRGALSRLRAQVRGAAALARLAAQCDTRASGLTRIACAHLYREAGRVEEAVARYREVALLAPADPRAPRAMGELLARSGRIDEALVAYESARAHVTPAERPALLEALLPLYGTARTPALVDRRAAAEAAAKELIALRPTDLAARQRAAEALAAVGAFEPAEQLFSALAAQRRDPLTRIPLLFRTAELAIEGHHDDAAATALSTALDLLPRRDSRRREALDRLVTIERKRDGLPALAAKWAALPDTRRDGALEELLGQILDEIGDGTNAIVHLRRAIALEPGALGPRRLLIRLHGRLGDEDAAIAEQRRLVSAARGDPRYALELAERLFSRVQGRKEALALAAEIARRTQDANTHAALAALYHKWNEKALALAEQDRLVRLEPDEPEHLIALGELYDQRGDKTMALKTWRRIAPGEHPPLTALLRLADVLAEHDQPGEALALLERAAHDHPADTTIERRLADVLDHLHRDEEAEKIYRRLLDAAVLADDATFVRAGGARWMELAARRGMLAPALAALSLIAEKPSSAARVELALLVARGRVRERRNLEAERALGQVVAKATRPSDRARALEALAELISPASPRANEALALLVRAAAEDPTRAAALFGKAATRAAALYRDSEALSYAERAVAQAPTDPEAQEHLGALLESHDPARALAAYDRALDLDPARDRLRLHAAELALRRGDDAGAAARYRALLARARDEQALEEASRRAVVVHELTGRLGELEREIAPRIVSTVQGPGNQVRPAMRHLLLEIETRYVPLLATRADAGDLAARSELTRVAGHALQPLLDVVLDGDREERNAAMLLLAQLGSPRAAPLLLRLAAGQAARRGSDPPSAELRIAAAQAAVWLTAPDDLARIEMLSTDPEQRIRLAATLMLARFPTLPRAATRLAALIDDDNDRVAATACLGIAEASPASKLRDKILAIALDGARPLSRRACAVAVARRGEVDEGFAHMASERVLAHASADLPAGLVRTLLASGSTRAVETGLSTALEQPALRQSLSGLASSVDGGPVSPPRTNAFIDPMTWLSTRLAAMEIAPGSRSAEPIVAAARSLLLGPRAALVLEDLAGPDSILSRLVASDASTRVQTRAELLDRLLSALVEQLHADPSGMDQRALVLNLLAERPSGVGVVITAAADARTRRVAVSALALAAPFEAAQIDPLVPSIRAALSASDWRERRAALHCIERQPGLAARVRADAMALRSDPNPLVAEAALGL